jgi:hypothetical protein
MAVDKISTDEGEAGQFESWQNEPRRFGLTLRTRFANR